MDEYGYDQINRGDSQQKVNISQLSKQHKKVKLLGPEHEFENLGTEEDMMNLNSIVMSNGNMPTITSRQDMISPTSQNASMNFQQSHRKHKPSNLNCLIQKRYSEKERVQMKPPVFHQVGQPNFIDQQYAQNVVQQYASAGSASGQQIRKQTSQTQQRVYNQNAANHKRAILSQNQQFLKSTYGHSGPMAQGMKSQGYAKRQIQNQGPNLVNEAKKNLGQKTVKRSHNYQMYSQQVNNYLTLHQNESNPNEISLNGFCVSPTQPMPGPATAVRAAPGYQSYREASHHGHAGHKNDSMAGPPSNKLILSLNNALEDVEQMNIHQYGTYNVKNNHHKNYFTSSKDVIEVPVRDASLEMVSPGGDYHGSVNSKQNQKLNKLKSIYRKKGGNNTASLQATAVPMNP